MNDDSYRTSSVAVLIPAYNEELVIEKTLRILSRLVPADNIFVVDDGSVDATRTIARRYTRNVYVIHNHGKAYAINRAIKYFELTKKFEYILLMDADTWPKSDFFEHALRHLTDDAAGAITCVVGRIKGQGINWISKYRQWEYHIAHFIHKRAQTYLQSIIVVPGCATVYRSSIFDRLEFPSGTMTEDMDFTFLMHRAGYHTMVFEDKAIVYTQDPVTLRDFAIQLTRWYTGFWQVVRKHDIPWQGQMLDFEVAMLALEGLYNGLIVLLFCIAALPLTFIGDVRVFAIPLALDFVFFLFPTLVWNAHADRDYRRILYVPHFYVLRFISSVLFLRGYFAGYLSLEKHYAWHSNRYVMGADGG